MCLHEGDCANAWMCNLGLSGWGTTREQHVPEDPRQITQRRLSLSPKAPLHSHGDCPPRGAQSQATALVVLPHPTVLSHALSALRRLERNLFNCSCDIRWIQLWQEKGEANLQYQDLYCMNMDAAIIPLQEMNITQCGKDGRGRARGRPGGCREGALTYLAPLVPCLGNLVLQNPAPWSRTRQLKLIGGSSWIKNRVSG